MSSLRNEVFSDFVNNLPRSMHWRWLRKIFNFHGRVIDTFIPKKRTLTRKRLGFIRFASKTGDESYQKVDGTKEMDGRRLTTGVKMLKSRHVETFLTTEPRRKLRGCNQ
ncbi:hypothetical protein Golob_015925 [Gossypium lobatum]|uniref:RRM domain-containing protein n=1 Tax=Gossypium lobatum TaxID=34289 RepID=A0A7J8M2L6_9ROSI|nr:hypothetical protein [Gossypium lobatum]